MVQTSVLLQAITQGIFLGGVFSLIAVGLTLVFGVMRILNFAHGELVSLGMYGAYLLFVAVGVDPYLGALVSIPVFLLAGAVIYRTLLQPILSAPEDMQLVMTFGLMIVLSNLTLLLFGADLHNIRIAFLDRIWATPFGSFRVGLLLAFVTSVTVLGALLWLIRYTDTGKAIRATADDRRGALVVGLNVQRVYLTAFALSVACAGIAGATLAGFLPVTPGRGVQFVLVAIVVVVLGGMGSFLGSLVGGLVVGLSQSVGEIFLPGTLSAALSLGLVIVILLVRPSGFFGARA
ncbi:MAG: branched-chain amino acid ABC transporter permease [Candidatus Rokubacteria bacterium]|nr:branched-chain amino acid ABC transporter permease [Candidatus Rokubacteria bacterium]